MRLEATTKPEVYTVSGKELRINISISEETREDINGSIQTFFVGTEVLLPTYASKAQIIEALIASRYSLTAELALTRKEANDPEKDAYLSFVSYAKGVASYVHSTLEAERSGEVFTDAEKGEMYDAALGVQAEQLKNSATLSPRQAKQALIILGKDEVAVATIAAIPDVSQRKIVQTWYADSKSWDYNSPVLTQFAAVLEIDKDEFFALAKTL